MYVLALIVNVMVREAYMLAFTESGQIVAHSPVRMNEIDWRRSGKIMWDYDPNCNLDMYLWWDDIEIDVYRRQVSLETLLDIWERRSEFGLWNTEDSLWAA